VSLTMVTRSAAALLVVATLSGCVAAAATVPSPTVVASAAPSASASVAATPTASPSLPVATETPVRTAAPTPVRTPQPTPVRTPQLTPANAGYCSVADALTPDTDYGDITGTYLDWTYRLPADYVPPDLVNAVTGGPAAGAPLEVRAVAYEDLGRLRAAALAAGHRLVIVSAYRSYQQQAQTFDYWTQVGGYEQALRTSARPGHSEHQLGTAIDFGDGTADPWAYADWAETPAGAWLAAHAADFGFVMSYPKGKTAVTCYSYEPWHYRYVGRELAQTLVSSGLTLREFQSATAARR